MATQEMIKAVIRLFTKEQLKKIYIDSCYDEQKPMSLKSHIEHAHEWEFQDYSSDTSTRPASHTQEYLDYIDLNLSALEDGERYLVSYADGDFSDQVEATYFAEYGLFSHIAGSIGINHVTHVEKVGLCLGGCQ